MLGIGFRLDPVELDNRIPVGQRGGLMESTIPHGTPVQFNGPVGGFKPGHEGQGKFDTTVKKGERGTYLGRHETLDDWHLAEVIIDGERFIVPGYMPVHFEVATQKARAV